MTAIIVTLAVMIGVIPCIIHSLREHGQWPTIAFFTGGFVFGIVRENIVALMPGMYTYPNHPLYIGAAPLMMGFGWSASFYACWMIGKRILEGFAPQYAENHWVVALITAIGTAFLSLPVEIAAGAPETSWWIWPADAIRVWYEMPPIVPFGWGGAAFIFILLFIRIMNKFEDKKKAAIVFVSVGAILAIIIHLLYVLIVRGIIVLIMMITSVG